MTAERPPQDRPRLREGARRGPTHPRLSIVEVLREAWRLYTDFLGRFFVIALVVFGLLALVQFASDESREFGVLAILIVATVVGLIWLQGAIAIAVDDARQTEGPTLSIREIFRRVRPQLWPLVGAGILIAAGVMAGLVLLVIPGLIILTVSSMVTPAIVLENKSISDAFARSWQLVKGDGLNVFAVILITVVLATVVSTVIGSVLQPLPDGVRAYLVTVVADAITVPFVALAWTVMYFELRLNRDPLIAREPPRG